MELTSAPSFDAMLEPIAHIFRSLNSRVVTTRSAVLRKLLKLNLLVSYYFNKHLQQLGGAPSHYLIDNFDGNLKLRVDRSRAMGSSLYWTGFHEFKEMMFLHRYLQPDMVVLDVGANLGEYAIFFAKRVPHGIVIAFEPVESSRRELIENCRLNSFQNIDIKDFGLSDRSQTITMYEIDDAHEGLSTLYPGGRPTRSRFDIQLRRLDEELGALGIERVDLIKIDIEGGELFALSGAEEAIQKYRPVVMIEINDVTYSAARYTSKDVDNFFSRLGYKPHRVSPGGDLVSCLQLPAFGNVIYRHV